MFPWQQYANSSSLKANIALLDEHGNIFTWRQIADSVNQFARLLTIQGVQSGSGVALYGKNSVEFVFIYLAAIQIGARVLGINPAFSIEKMQQICQNYQVGFYFSPEINETFPNLTALSLSIRLEKTKVSNTQNENEEVVDFLRPATMTLTSGSTGLPKAVVHNIRAHLDNAQGVCKLMRFEPDCSWLLSLPLYHVSGQGIVWRWLYSKAALHLPREDFYQSVLQATHASLVPTQLQRLLSYLAEESKIKRITKHILLGGTQIPVELTQKLKEYGIQSYSGYGMTEMASTVFAKRSDHSDGVGTPLEGREYCLQNEEIWLRGAGLAMGYWQDGKILSLLNSQGWFSTKDLGKWIDNELFIVGRLDNQFISGGENIQPEEIENVISRSGLVKQIFVLPIEDTEFGQRPVALVEFIEQFSQRAVENLRVFLQSRIERFKQPIAYYPLPQNVHKGAIKISRNRLKDWLANQPKR
ncbi:o-succinylbenzoate--CoA ligase [Rodentibacter caecimuris]|uniref:O-succinylbenzoate--CoA ligase n=1 Tax=Rodentibacter caecimuris TaxID=1796644 RepID=A0ABX3KW41_9PAST|nr:o-succinylbenzoate--CoA ligase [Rodentibacter heylii]